MPKFILNNKSITTTEVIGMTLLDYIRYNQQLTGTKIGCREGDCGACTVLVGTLNDGGEVEYRSITSCISPLGNAHGKHIVTIEGTNLLNRLNAVQESMKSNYATQCGFCTPGFTVSLTGYALAECGETPIHIKDAISGNICRCTGYKSIERAADEVFKKIKNKEGAVDLQWLVDNEFIPNYFQDIPKRLQQIGQFNLKITGKRYVSGGTDLYVKKADELFEEEVNLIFDKPSLNGIDCSDKICHVGAGATVSDVWNNKDFNIFFPDLSKHLKLVSSEQIRNMASIGGNFVNASPIGDMTIFFLALNSQLTIANESGNERILALNKLFKSYKNLDLKEDELLKDVHFPILTPTTKFNFEKVCKRKHLDIASVNSAMSILVEKGIVKEVHLSIGGVDQIPKYLSETCAFLKDKKLNLEVVMSANQVLQEEISPISDIRGTIDYKRLLARQLFYAHFLELFPNQFKLKDFVH